MQRTVDQVRCRPSQHWKVKKPANLASNPLDSQTGTRQSDLEAGGLLGQSPPALIKHDGAEALAPSEIRAMLEKHRLEVVSLEEKLESQAAELRSLEAKLDEKEKDARRVAEEHKERLAESQTSLEAKLEMQAAELRHAKRMAEERKELLDELKKATAPGLLTTSTRTDLHTSASTLTTRGIPSSLAMSLDDARADAATGMRKHDEIVHNYSIILHESPQVVLEALMGSSLESGIGDLRQQVRDYEEWGDDMEPVQNVEQLILTT